MTPPRDPSLKSPSAPAGLALLCRASDILAETLDYEATLTRVPYLGVPHLGDWCVLAMSGPDGALQHFDLAYPEGVSEAMQASVREAIENFVNTSGNALLQRDTVWLKDVYTANFAGLAPPEAFLAALRQAGVNALLSVPLVARHRNFGRLTFFAADPARFEAESLPLAQDLARRAALAIDNARLYREAQRAVALRDEFLSVASHELRTPLTALFLQLDSLLPAIDKGPEALFKAGSRKLPRMRDQVDRLDRLIGELLTVARIQTNRLEVVQTYVELGAMVAEMAERFTPLAAKVGSKLTFKGAGAIPGFWDSTRLEQIVANLLTNAIRYGNGQPIDVRLEANAEVARIIVRDHGIGIAPENQDRVFKRFERVNSVRNYGGLGLGLWIVRQILTAMGGTIHLQSAAGKGSTFTVELPRRAAVEGAASASLPQMV